MEAGAGLRLMAMVTLIPPGLLSAQSQCGNCHAKQSAQFPKTPMAQALLSPDKTQVLAKELTFRDGPWRYRITGTGGVTTYHVSDGSHTFEAPILWSFGAGEAGQTYVYKHRGDLYESRVSYYTRIKGLDLTLGAEGSTPSSLTMAAGRKMLAQDVAECFGCHSTGPSPGARFAMDTMRPGVHCGACHADVQQHEASMTARIAQTFPAKLSKLSTEQVSELCGRCHRTWEQIMINGPKGIVNVRFQPYRLTNSKCYDAEDRRISCVACHDPHLPLEKRAAAYDVRCVSCHSSGSSSRAASHVCKTGKTGCTNCHMPKLEIPGSHMIFSDHQIRVVSRKGEYPN
jgi:hypothetical protein